MIFTHTPSFFKSHFAHLSVSTQLLVSGEAVTSVLSGEVLIFTLKQGLHTSGLRSHAYALELLPMAAIHIPKNLESPEAFQDAQAWFSETFYKVKPNSVKLLASLWLHKPKTVKDLYLDYVKLGGFTSEHEALEAARLRLSESTFQSAHLDLQILTTNQRVRHLLKRDETQPDPLCFSHPLVTQTP